MHVRGVTDLPIRPNTPGKNTVNPKLAEREAQLRRLMVASQAGDGAAYTTFLHELAALLRGFYRRRLFNLPDDIEDLVQETLLAVHNKRHTYLPDQPVTAWLHAIARYKLVDLLRARSVREALHDPLDDTDADELVAAPVEQADEARRDLMALLADLPDKQRLPIQYMKIEGLSVREAAARTGLSESAVKVGVHRGLKILAARIRSAQ
jgi:RNA polymerase sigma-70 factor, ECF subfamily